MDVFKLSKNWFDFCFENPEKINPNHAALYFFCIEHCNRLGWKEKFGFPMEMAKDAIGIRNYRTYSKTFNDLVEWGFIKMYEKSKNQYSANIIAIAENTKANTKALTKAIQKQVQKQVHGIVGVDIPETRNQKPEIIKSIFDEARKLYPGIVRGNETEFENFKKHPDYETELPKLSTAIHNQINDRTKKLLQKKFSPEWKNFKTWINQRCWEEEVNINLIPAKPTYSKFVE